MMRAILGALAAILLAGCGTPVSVSRVPPRAVTEELTRSALNADTPSFFSRNVLHRWNLVERFGRDPRAALERLHQLVIEVDEGREQTLFALAELSFAHAERTGRQDFYLEAAIAAWAFLFPGDGAPTPDEFDPRLGIATDLYNRGLTRALASGDGSVVELRSGLYALPFGRTVSVHLEPDALRWADRDLVEFVPVAELRVRGLRARHRQPGIGAPLAARAAIDPERPTWDRLWQKARIPVTALLRIDDARRQLREPVLRGSLELYGDATQRAVAIDGREVPLEAEPTAALAWSLSELPTWRWERRGFFRGDFLHEELPTGLTFVEPYRPGRIPVVLVHGTASSVGRWGDMLNDLLNVARVRDRFQFWVFTFPSGSPVAYSAMLLREALAQAVEQLDPEGADAALRQMVVIGHSQGGLLVKMTVVESGTRIWDTISQRPIGALELTDETRALFERTLIVRPLPFVRRVVFVATPHRGSALTTGRVVSALARFVTLPVNVLGAAADLLEGNADAILFDPRGPRFGSVYDMRPGSPFLEALADIPIAPGVAAHSIIPVRGAEAGDGATDGVVTFNSARLDGVESETVIPFAGHSVQGHPATIEEVRRILLEHARALCQASGVACGRPAPGRPRLR